tara:strand:- start:1954 stop:3222 length:1269 start_codon:yes stop_codon:yes gene_type:complete
MIDILLFFLGIKSWDVNFFPVMRHNIQETPRNNNLRNSKTVNTLKLIAEDTPSPKLSTYQLKRNVNVNLQDKLFYTFYTIYSFIIFLLMCVQPIYTLYSFSKDGSDLKFLTSFLTHLNVPVIYIWEKLYFRSDHLEKRIKCKKLNRALVYSSAVLSIIINFLDITSFYNGYYWTHLFKNDILFFVFIIIEWIYSRLIIFLYAFSFVFVMDSHISVFKDFINNLEINEWCEECDSPLTKIIKDVVIIRRNIESTISYYNDIISITTLLGGLSFAIFIRDIIPPEADEIKDIRFEDHDRYLIHPTIVYISCQIALLVYMMKYAMQRNRVLKYVKSIEFINKFLSKIPDEKIHEKTNGKLDVVTLNIADSNSETLDWIILGNILSEQWLDFTIFGVSTSDGSLIKKSAGFGSALLFGISFLQNNN